MKFEWLIDLWLQLWHLNDCNFCGNWFNFGNFSSTNHLSLNWLGKLDVNCSLSMKEDKNGSIYGFKMGKDHRLLKFLLYDSWFQIRLTFVSCSYNLQEKSNQSKIFCCRLHAQLSLLMAQKVKEVNRFFIFLLKEIFLPHNNFSSLKRTFF